MQQPNSIKLEWRKIGRLNNNGVNDLRLYLLKPNSLIQQIKRDHVEGYHVTKVLYASYSGGPLHAVAVMMSYHTYMPIYINCLTQKIVRWDNCMWIPVKEAMAKMQKQISKDIRSTLDICFKLDPRVTEIYQRTREPEVLRALEDTIAPKANHAQ